jgi:hypothetical protein
MNILRKVLLPLVMFPLLPFLSAKAQESPAAQSPSAPWLVNTKSASGAPDGYKLPVAAFGSFVERPANNLRQQTNQAVAPSTPPSTSKWRDPQVSHNSEIEAVPPHLGKSFWFPWVAAVGLSIASTELTVRCVNTPGCTQPNPMWGTSPSRLKLYGAKGGADAVGFFFSRRLKLDKHGERAGWKYIAYGILGWHAAETGWSAEALAALGPGASSGAVL